ncbi:uncharacterized protein LOC128674868 isoform X2 [Plodia interpunctella]|uniref:uncharacterized protein LOC128674868 isoform X2 n=1 Tax=Plodia interpunctella TaxID=58824 RepID=UPI002367A035|nr:uncharacterized protein LOC128674868 isoform X2 [Plodia interpunctella]XP_053609817.1 uncharacterized protein LOC128674868 isoform X2 [Plodia interpunctella]
MSEGDVTLIRDEDVLRRMWQQTEDFSRKKEIRAHMYKLREERLRDLYSSEPAQAKDLKELSNAGWNVESENKTTDDGHTHVKSVNANIEGRYDVEGGRGQFAAFDQHRQAVTEYQDENSSLKRNECASNTAAREQVVRQTDDGTQISSTTTSSSSSSKFQQVSSTKNETVPYLTNDDYDRQESTYDTNTNQESRKRQVNQTEEFERNLRRSDVETGELVSRKIDYPDENTKVVVETRCLPDGTRVTSTRKEFRGTPVVQKYSEQHSHQSRNETKSSYTSTHKSSDIRESSSKIIHDSDENRNTNIVDTQKKVDNLDFKRKQTEYIVTEDSHKDQYEYSSQKRNDQLYKHQEREIYQPEGATTITNNDRNENRKTEHVTDNTEINYQKTVEKTVDQNVERNISNDQYQTTYQSDFTQKNKISNDWSPTHQAWASTLRADTPSTTRPSTRASSPGMRTDRSSTASLRSSVSPDKTFRKPFSCGASPSKVDRCSPTRSAYSSTYSTHSVTNDKTNRHNSPEGRPPSSGRSPTRQSPEKKPFDSSRQRPSVSPEKRPYDSPRYSASPERKVPHYQSPTENVLQQQRDVVSTRFSTSPERKPFHKDSPITTHAKATSPNLPTDQTSYSTRRSQTPERKYPSEDSIAKRSSPEKTPCKPDIFRETSPKRLTEHKEPSRTSSRSPEKSVTHNSKSSQGREKSEPKIVKDNSSPVKIPAYMKPIDARKQSPAKSPSPVRKINKTTKVTEDHYKFIDEETKMYTRKDDETTTTTKKHKASNVDDQPTGHDNRDSPDHCRSNSPYSTSATRSTLRKGSRSPSPPKGPVTFYQDNMDTKTTSNIHTDNFKDNNDITKYSIVKESPVKEPSPTKYGTYDKKQRYSEEIDEHTTITDDVRYDSSIREKSDFSRKSPNRSSSTMKTSPRDSLSPNKSVNNKKFKQTIDFISTERTTEEIHKSNRDRPRQLVTPSTSPTRKPKTPKTVETAPSTGQSSPTTSVSEFVYYSSPKIETSEMVTDLDDQEYLNEVDMSNEITTIYKRPENLDIKRSPSPSKIPCRSSPQEKSPVSSIPRKSSLKKPSQNIKQISPIEKPPSSFQISPTVEIQDFPEHKVVKKDYPEKSDTPTKIKPPLERRETYDERCRKILGMVNDDTITSKSVKTEAITKEKESIPSSPSISPCYSPKEGMLDSQTRKSKFNNTTENESDSKYTTQSLISEIEFRVNNDHTDVIKNNKTTSREQSPTKLEDITNFANVTHNESTSFYDVDDISKKVTHKSSNKISKDVETKSPIRLSPEKRVSQSPDRKPNLKPSRTPSPTKITTTVTEITSDFLMSEREKEILDKVQKSLRKLSPERGEKSPSRERSPSKTTTSLQHLDITAASDEVRETSLLNESDELAEHKTKIIEKSGLSNINHKSSSKPSSRNVSPVKKSPTTPKTEQAQISPTKPRSTSPKKLASADRPLSPQTQKVSGIKPREPVTSNLTRKPTSSAISTTKVDKTITTTDTKKILKQNSSTRINTSKITPNKLTTKFSEPEMKRTSTSKGEVHVTRSPSDNSIKPKNTSPQRMRSKPEIQVNDISTSKKHVTTTTTNKYQKTISKQSQSRLPNKPKSATALNSSTDENDIIIDVQQAKSSRENSPDRICPTPVGFMEDVGTPRFPDEVSEPDDEFYKRTHHTIQEAESIVDDIVEICEDDELFVKQTNINRVTGSDECLLNVNDKVSKFTNKVDSVKKPKSSTTQFKDTEKRAHSDFVTENMKSDECLLSVSEKVNKFAKGPRDTEDSKSPSRRIVDEYDTETVYQDDYTKLSVNDKAHLFVETAENAKTTKVKSTQKVERPDLSNVDESLKSDDCLLSVSDKVNKFVKTAEQFLVETISDEEKERKIREQHDKIMKKIVDIDDDTPEPEKVTSQKTEIDSGIKKRKSLDHHDESLKSLTKETVSSHAKLKETGSPNIKQTERTPTVKITTLRSSEAVKKAKALFENIASTTRNAKDITTNKTTKLTDIGVMKKSPKTDSTIVLPPSSEDASPNVTDSEVDGVPYRSHLINRPSSSTSTRLQPSKNEERPRTPNRLTPQPTGTSRTVSPLRHVESVTTTKTVLSRYPSGQSGEVPKPTKDINEKAEKPQDKIPSYQRPTKTSQSKEETRVVEETEVSSRRGSGKFGVELRRTSVERSTVSSERRRSVEHPCIEDIFDLDLLEQMLEKVVGYEQRRRIRSQIRVAKKKCEEQSETTTQTRSTKQTTVTITKNISTERLSQNRSPERKQKSTPQRTLSPLSHVKTTPQKNGDDIDRPRDSIIKPMTNGHSKETVIKITDKHHRRLSPEKLAPKMTTRTKSPLRQLSPEKKTRPLSPSKIASPKPKQNKFNEYASAYMKKVGLNENDKIKFAETKTKKSSDIGEQKTVKGVEERKVLQTKSTSSMKHNMTERTSSKDIIVTNGKRSPSPAKKRSPERQHEVHVDTRPRSPSPILKRQKSETANKETIIKSVYDIEKKIQSKPAQEEKPSWVTNRNLKKITSETRTFSSKKIEADKPKYRAPSPSKVISKPIDVITSSYGPGPLDADGRPLFGIKALRNGATNYQVKGTVVRQEFHSRNGGEPEGSVSVTAYSSAPEELERLLAAQGERPSRLHGLAAITTTKKFGGDTGTSYKEAHTKEERAALEQFTHHDRRVASSRVEIPDQASQQDRLADRRGLVEKEDRIERRQMDNERAERRGVREERREDRKTVRQSSVKSLTEKYIKSASETSKTERSAYPKAGLILRTATMKDSVSSDSSAHAGLARTDSEHSLASVEDVITDSNRTSVTTTDRDGRTITTTTDRDGRTVTTTRSIKEERSFLDSSTKVSGVQDILTRMKNADIVIQEGDTTEDTEARALLNKFLGATVLMAGMQSYVNDQPSGKLVIKQQETVRSGGRVTSDRRAEVDIDQCWDERVLRKLLDECSDYEQRRRLRARIRTLMAEQEACASAVTEALAAAGETTEGDNADARGESLLLPLLQGLLGSGGERLLAGLGAAGADVVADVRRSLARLRAALAPPADHPQARALLTLADRLEDALDAADRLDGCRRKPRRRSRANRHTVGVTHEELAEARRLVDRDHLALNNTAPEPQTPSSGPASTISGANSIEEPSTPERKPSIDENVSYHDAVASRQKQAPLAHSASFAAAPIINRDHQVIERRVHMPKKPDFFRHSMGDGLQQQLRDEKHPHENHQLRQERRPSKSGIAAIANKFDAQAKEAAPSFPVRRAPISRSPPPTKTPIALKQIFHEETKHTPNNRNMYKPLPPTYNFAAPPVEEVSKPLSRFNNNNNNKRLRMKRANTIDIGRPYAGYKIDSDTDDEGGRRGPLVPEFHPQTDNDKKFVAFMRKNQDNDQITVNGQTNWSNRFGNIKNAFESRERDDHSRSSSASSAKHFWRTAEETPRSNYVPRPRKFQNDVNNSEIIKPPWAQERRETLRVNIPPPQLPPTQAAPLMPPTPPTPRTQINHPPIPQSPTKPLAAKQFVAKPIPVNQFSHAPMSAFKPPTKIVSPVNAPSHVWSPPSLNNTLSPTADAPPSYPIAPKPIITSPPVPSVPWVTTEYDKPRRVVGTAAKFDTPKYDAPLPSNPPPYRERTFATHPPTPPTHAPSQNFPDRQLQNFPVKSIPSQNNLAAPELVKKIDVTKPPAPAAQYAPKVDAQKLQIEFYEKQIRDRHRHEQLTNGHHETSECKPPPPPSYTVTDYTPSNMVSTFMPLQQTPDIEKARAHKIDYLPDVVMNENDRQEYQRSPTRPQGSPYSPRSKAPAQAYQNGDTSYTNGTDEGPPTEHGSVVTRVMRGPVRGAATITAGVRTRHDEERRGGAADSLRGALDKLSFPKRDVLAKKNAPRSQVRAPVQNGPSPQPAHAPPPRLLPDSVPPSPGGRSPALAASRESVLSSESAASAGSSPLSRSGSWHQLADRSPQPQPTSPRRVMNRTKSMHLLAVPKMYEGGISRDELTDKKKTVEAYFSGQTSSKSHAAAVRARSSRSQQQSYSLGRSRTMPTVSELQFLDESNADDAFEDLVSALA